MASTSISIIIDLNFSKKKNKREKKKEKRIKCRHHKAEFERLLCASFQKRKFPLSYGCHKNRQN